MGWHYRAGYTVTNGHRHYQVYEDYRKIPEVNGWAGPIEPRGETKQELIEDLEMMLEDVKKFNALQLKTTPPKVSDVGGNDGSN